MYLHDFERLKKKRQAKQPETQQHIGRNGDSVHPGDLSQLPVELLYKQDAEV